MKIRSSESAGDRKRKYLFKLFSRNLHLVKQHSNLRFDPDEDGFICPICFRFFSLNGLSKLFDDHLTLEDIPPSSLGGYSRTLTCKLCNNKGGSELESHLKNQIIMNEFMQGLSNIWETAIFSPYPGINLPATIHIRGDKEIIVEGDPKRTNPEAFKNFSILSKSQPMSEFKLILQAKYKINRPEIALLRIAYLSAFSYFGYGFLINSNIHQVRTQILYPTTAILSHWCLRNAIFPDAAIGLNIIVEPKELLSYLCIFDLKTKQQNIRYGVILPGPTKPGLEIYDWLLQTSHIEQNITYKKIPDDNYLTNPDLVFASHCFWNEAKLF